MKRFVPGGLLLLLVAVGTFLWWGNTRSSVPASQVAPVDCLVYVELPNLVQTSKRWPDTALSRILDEPSVQRFLRQPISKAPASYHHAWDSFAALRCSALFFGITDPEKDQWICGLQSNVNQSTWRRQLNNFSKAVFGQNLKEMTAENLAGESTGQTKGKAVTEVYCVRVGSWTLLSRSGNLLLEAIRNSQTALGGLQSVKLFQECRAHLPTSFDLLSFVKGRPSLDPSAGLHWRFRDQEPEGSNRAVIATTTIVGARLRDTVFTLNDTPTEDSSLDRKGLAMTSPSTIGYLATQIGFSEIWRWCGQLAEESQLAETIRNYMEEVKSFGIEPRDLDKLVSGAEVIVDRDPKTDSLNCGLALQVTDPAKFQHFMDQVVAEKFPEISSKVEIASVPAYVMQINERVSLVFGLSGRRLLISGGQQKFAELVGRLQNPTPGLEADNQFQAIAKLVDEPKDLFAYLDAKSGFERFYDASRPMLVFGILMMPALNRYLDAMALPDTAEISKHLSPIVLSRHRVPNGVIDESVGPITAYETVALLLGGAWAMGFWER